MNYRFDLKLSDNKHSLCFFSLPQTNSYQEISSLEIESPDYQIVNDLKRGNKILVSKNININFLYKSKTINKKIKKDFTINNYKKNYLDHGRNINSYDPQIISLKRKIIGNEKKIYKIIYKIYEFVIDYLTYGKPIKGLYSYKQALNEKVTDCGGFSTLLASLLQSTEIPCRLVSGFLIKKNIFTKLFSNFEFYLPADLSLVARRAKWEVLTKAGILTFNSLSMHAWLEALLPNNDWFPLDPSIEWRRRNDLTKRLGGYGFIPDDRLVVSYGHDFKIKFDGKVYKFDLLQNPIFV